MDSAPEFLDLFVEPTGELIYFLAVIAISQAAMLMVLGQRMRGRTEVAAGRYTGLLTGVVLAWISLMGGGLYALITDTADKAVLPPLERAVSAIVIVLASAALLVADSDRRQRGTWVLIFLVTAGLVLGYVYTAGEWYDLAAIEDFNDHRLGLLWTFLPGVFIIVAMSLLVTRFSDTADIPLKLLVFVILLIGYSYTLTRMTAGDLEGHTSGALRLSFMAALAIVVTIVYRLVLDRLSSAIDEVSEYAEAISKPQPPVVLPPTSPPPPPEPTFRPAGRPATVSQAAESMTLLKAIGLMLEKDDPDTIPRQIATAVATVLKADVVALVSHEDENWADMIAAYDHIQQRHIPGLALNLDEQPTLVKTLQDRRQARLTETEHLD
ncbi:MAG: hypothetical protein GYB65_06865, partial [Chloroflexi bacterium]|nr:hypothetical protein [Chloroflexota bacterium]